MADDDFEVGHYHQHRARTSYVNDCRSHAHTMDGAGVSGDHYGNFRMTSSSPGMSAKSLAFEVSSRKSR